MDITEKDLPSGKGKGWSPTAIVLGPAGIKAFLELGALAYLEQIEVLSKIEWFVGVSAGALISYLLVLGFTIREAIGIFMKYNVFNDIKHFDYRDVLNKLGLLSNDGLRGILVEATILKFGKILTLEELYQKTQKRFTVVTLDITNEDPTKSSCVYMSHDNYPKYSAIEAVLCSSNIPLLFQKQKIDGRCFVDGVLGNPYPVNLCDDGTRDVLGLYVTGVNSRSVDCDMVSYLDKIIDASANEHRCNNINNSGDRCGNVHLKGSTRDPLGLTVTVKDKRRMVKEGHDTMAEWWKKNVGRKCD